MIDLFGGGHSNPFFSKTIDIFLFQIVRIFFTFGFFMKDGYAQVVKSNAVLNFFVAVLTKIISFGAQIVLAWYLTPEIFGLVAIASSVTSFASFFAAAGIGELLVRDQEGFEKKSASIFWLSLILNVIATLVAVLFAFLSPSLFSTPSVKQLILLIVISWPIGSLTMMLSSRLKTDLRVKSVAFLSFADVIIYYIFAVFFAMQHMGPLALILPHVIRSFISPLLHWYFVRKIILWPPSIPEMRQLLKKSIYVMLGTALQSLATQIPIFFLGMIANTNEVGIISWSYQMSSQALFSITLNIRSVLISVFSKFQSDQARLERAYTRTIQIMILVLGLATEIQVLISKNLINLIFPRKWDAAGDIVAVLSFGLVGSGIITITTAILAAKAEFKLQAVTLFIFTLLSALMPLAGYKIDGIMGAAVGIAISTLLSSFIVHLFAAKTLNVPKNVFFQKKQWALVISFVFGLVFHSGFQMLNPISVIFLTVMASLFSFFITLRLIDPETFHDIKTVFRFKTVKQ